jgi:hypothetical protein
VELAVPARRPTLPTHTREAVLVEGGNAMGIGLKQTDKLSRGCAWRWVESRRVRRKREV